MTASAWIALTMFALSAHGQEQKRICGLVENLQGTVYWRPHSGATPKILDRYIDNGKILHSGESLRCGKNGGARIWLAGQEQELRESREWLSISCGAAELQNPSQDQRTEATQAALEYYGRPAGRSKGRASMVYLPANGSTMQADHFAVAWIPRPALGKGSVVLQTAQGEQLWIQSEVDGSSGTLDSGMAREALAEYSRRPLRSELFLNLEFASGESCGVSFSVLSEGREPLLARDLASATQGVSGLLAHIRRSYVFNAYELWNRAADEYEDALREAPRSRDLLLADLAAQRRIGNTFRIEQLEKLLGGKSGSANEQ